MARISFARMWQLIDNNYSTYFGKYRTVFTRELMAAIFWEETLFENTKQLKGGPAVGFGQVEKPQIKNINRRFATTFDENGTDVLHSEAQSVQLAGLALAAVYEDQLDKVKAGKQILPFARHAALLNYAGWPKNQDKPPRWEACERELLKLSLGPPPLALDQSLTAQIKAALRLSRTAADVQFQATFP